MRRCCHPIYCLMDRIAAIISGFIVNMLPFFPTPKNRTFILTNAETVVTHLYEMFLHSMLHKINSQVFMFLSYNEK